MPENAGFTFSQIKGRSIVQLRVRPKDAEIVARELQLPVPALRWRGGYLVAHWLGPDQWLLTSDTIAVGDIIDHIDTKLPDQLYAATDMSSDFKCFRLHGPGARTVLSMGCGLDMHASAFKSGHCTRTYFAGVMLFIVAVGDDDFDLYVDRSLARYLRDWIEGASKDPLTHQGAALPHSSKELI